MKIMFICTGNICRSAMAHAMFEKMVKEQNKNVQVYSCGIYAQMVIFQHMKQLKQ